MRTNQGGFKQTCFFHRRIYHREPETLSEERGGSWRNRDVWESNSFGRMSLVEGSSE